MKKKLLVLVAGMLVLAGCGKKADEVKDVTFTVVNGAALVGDFVEGFSNNSYDKAVRELINDETTYYIDGKTGEIKYNANVLASEPKVEKDADGNVTYTFTLKGGHKWSDDTEITAKDYVFSFLFRANPNYFDSALTKFEVRGEDLVGYDAYVSGESAVFEGVKYIDDKTFSLTIDGKKLPYYYERNMVTTYPDPIHVWMPNAKINADGNRLDNTAEEIQAAAKVVKEKERFKPSVSSGPYTLENYDSNKVATLTINPNYSGDFEGKKPTIKTVVIKNVDEKLLIDSISKGEADLTTNVIQGPDIKKGLDAKLNNTNFARNAYGKILIDTQKGTTAIKEVRQALGYLVDRNEFVEAITGGYGATVDGPYGLSMSFYQNKAEEIKEKIHQYNYNPDEANKLLDQTDYKFEADGVTPFDASKASKGGNYYRHNSKGEVLEIQHYGTKEAGSVTDLINSSLPTSTAAAGLKYTVTIGDWTTMTTSYMNNKVENPYQGYNFATSYTAVYEPRTAFRSDYVGRSNYSRIADPKLDDAINALISVEPGDTEGFEEAFVEYVTVWNDLLPELPLYSNQVYAFATNRVKGLEVLSPIYDWYDAITNITIEE